MKRLIFLGLFVAATAWALPTQKINVTGSAGLNVLKAGDTMTGPLVNSTNGAASTPPFSLTGTIFTGGSATTTKPHLLIEPAGTTSTAWNTSGTLLGVNGPTGYTGLLADFQVSGTSKAYVTNGGTVSGNAIQSGQFFPASNNTTLQLGLTRSYSTASTTAVAIGNNTHSQSSGTNIAVSIIPTINTSGTAANTDLLINRTQTATGSGAQNLIDAQVGGTSKFKVDNTGSVTTAVAIPATSGGTAQSTYTTGDTLYSSGTNALSKLAIGSAGQHMVVSGGVPAWEDFLSPSKYVAFYDDFLGGGTLGSPYFASIVNGTSASVGTTATAGNGATVARPGTVVFYAGSTSGSGYAQLYGDSRNALLSFSGGSITYETALVIYALSNGTTRFRIDAGMIAEIAPSSSIANGCYFTYSDTINSGNWQFNCTTASSTTSVDTGIAASTSWVKLGFVMNAAGTSVQAYVNGSAAGSAITTNIPTGNGVTFVWQINKTVGTGVAQFTIDYLKFLDVLTSAR